MSEGRKVGELNGKWALLFKVSLGMFPVLTTIGLTGGSWIVGELREMRKDLVANRESVVRIEASRFTAADGKEVWKSIADIRTEMAKFPADIPPKWFVDRVDRIEKNLDRTTDGLAKLTETVTKIHAERGATP